jgi:hypothetical protein
MYKSTDAGVTWSPSNSGVPAGAWNPRSVAVSAASPTMVLVGFQDWGVYKSTSSGQTWTRSDGGIAAYNVNWIAPHPTVDGTVFAMPGGQGIWKSTDYGATWAAANTGLTGTSWNGMTLAYTPGAPNTMYAGFNGLGLWKSTDGGGTWAATSLTGHSIFGVVVDPQNPSIIYAATGDGVYKSTNGGTGAWTPMNSGLPGTLTFAITMTGTTLLVSEVNSGVYRWPSGASSWTLSNTGMSNGTNLLLVDAGGAIYAQGYSSTYRSTNAGMSWSQISGTAFAVAVDPTRAATAYLGSTTGPLMRRTLNSFGTTVPFADGLPTNSIASGFLAIDRSGGAVYFGQAGHGILRAVN